MNLGEKSGLWPEKIPPSSRPSVRAGLAIKGEGAWQPELDAPLIIFSSGKAVVDGALISFSGLRQPERLTIPQPGVGRQRRPTPGTRSKNSATQNGLDQSGLRWGLIQLLQSCCKHRAFTQGSLTVFGNPGLIDFGLSGHRENGG